MKKSFWTYSVIVIFLMILPFAFISGSEAPDMGRSASIEYSVLDSIVGGYRNDIPEYDFVDMTQNRIDGEMKNYGRVWAKLDSILCFGKGGLRILHLGGSHVQGGVFTHKLRHDFMSLKPDIQGNFGFAFPYTAARTNTPYYYVSHYEGNWTSTKCLKAEPAKRLGLMGMAVSTKDTSASVNIVTRPRTSGIADSPMPMSRLRLLGYSDGDISPVLVNGADTLAGVEDDFCLTFDLPSKTDSVVLGFCGTEGEYTITGMYLDDGDCADGITVTGVGVNGGSLVSYSRCPDFQRDLKLLMPDLVILAIGINDATSPEYDPEVFKSRYKDLVSRILAVNPDCAILFVSNNDSCRRIRKKGYVTNQNGPVAEKAFSELAEEYEAGYWNLFGIMGGLGSMRKWEASGLARRDKVHFTERGYMLLGDLLFDALMERYKEHVEVRQKGRICISDMS